MVKCVCRVVMPTLTTVVKDSAAANRKTDEHAAKEDGDTTSNAITEDDQLGQFDDDEGEVVSLQQELGSEASWTSQMSRKFRKASNSVRAAFSNRVLLRILRRHVQSTTGRAKTSDANSFVDSSLQMARGLIKNEGLDPMKLNDDECVFEEKVIFIRLSASLTFLATYLKGISTLRRQGDASLELDGDWLTLQTQLTTTKIECGSNCTAKFMDIGPNFELTVDVDAVTVNMKARIHTVTMQIVISTFEVIHVGDVDAECDGLFPLDPLLGAISECFIKRCKGNIVKVFEFEAMCQLEAALKRMDFTQLVRSYGRRYINSVTGLVTAVPLPGMP